MTNSDSSTLAVLGLGPVGQALAAAALTSGRPTVIWNRTQDKAARLVGQGARLAPTAAEAVHQASTVVCCVLNYRVLRMVVDDVAGWSGTTLVNLTSGHSGEARAMAAWATERGIPYLDGAILTPAPTIGTSSASILYCGPGPVFERNRATLETFAATTVFLGDDHGAAAGYEMALLDLFVMAVGGLAHAFAMAAAEGIAPVRLAPFAKGIGGLLTGMIDRFASQLQEGHFPGETSSIASASSAITHVIEAAGAHGLDAAPLRTLQTIMERAVAAGHGGDGYARLTHVIAEHPPTPWPSSLRLLFDRAPAGNPQHMGDYMDRAKDLADQHDDQVDKGIERAGDEADERTGGKYGDKIDKGVDEAQERTGDGEQTA